MTIQTVSEQDYLNAVNTALQNHECYVEGMEVVGLVDNYGSLAKLSDYLWEGPDYIASDLQQIVEQISQKYSIAG